jgi:hypothetical protein
MMKCKSNVLDLYERRKEVTSNVSEVGEAPDRCLVSVRTAER